MGYALFFISHAKDKVFKREDGSEFNMVVPTLSNSYNEIIKDMADIYGYAHQVRTEDGTTKVKLTLRSLDGTVDSGSRFKYIEPEIDFTYEALVSALNKAIDKEAELTNNKYITDEKIEPVVVETLDYDDLMKEFTTLVSSIPQEKMETYFAPRITQIVERSLGKGKKISNATIDQVEQIGVIVDDLKELIANAPA